MSAELHNLEFKEVLEHIAENFPSATEQNFKEHQFARFIRDVPGPILRAQAGLDREFYIVGSPGKGRWAEVPWISVFISNITTTATQGYYVVFLFRADMSGVYISLNQGWTYFKDKYGNKIGREKIKKTGSLIRSNLNSVPAHLQEKEIELKSFGDLGKGYELGHIYGRYYDFNFLPSNQEIINDLHALLNASKEIENLIGNRSISQFNDYLLSQDDGNFLENDEEEASYQNEVNYLIEREEKEPSAEIEEGPKQRPEPLVSKGGGKRWPRCAKTAAEALRLANYKCTFDESHETFISKVTGKPFMESHHLILMKDQHLFENDLDRVANIVSLCPTCHRAIHHGIDGVKEKILNELFNKRRDQLEAVGIGVTFTRLKEGYGI